MDCVKGCANTFRVFIDTRDPFGSEQRSVPCSALSGSLILVPRQVARDAMGADYRTGRYGTLRLTAQQESQPRTRATVDH